MEEVVFGSAGGGLCSALRVMDILSGHGNLLALDLASVSSGVALYEDGELKTFNIILPGAGDDVSAEARLRRELRGDLQQLVSGKSYRACLVEDVYSGLNVKTSRILYALNSVIDDLILDGVCECQELVRVNNKTWKSWLKPYAGGIRALNDKEYVKAVLAGLGWYEDEEYRGYQDRLDALGIMVGWVSRYLLGAGETHKFADRILWSRVRVRYEIDEDLLDEKLPGDRRCEYISGSSLSREKMIDYLEEDRSKVYITQNPVLLGRVCRDKKLDSFTGGGFCAFWYAGR